MSELLAVAAAAMAGAGVAQALAASWLVSAFARRPAKAPGRRPAVSVLKPLHGDEPLLEEALASLCALDYPEYQIVFGVGDPADPAVAVVRRLQARFPDRDMTLVTDMRQHGANRKISNLINMFPSVRHDVLVIADSDVHVRPDYLDRLVAALEQPGTGLATTLYVGVPGRPGLVASLGAMQVTQVFLPGAVLARALGRQDCLGATMCLRRRDLMRIGGLRALVDHLADDNVLGRRIRDIGLGVALAGTVPLTTVPETSWPALFRHELRWARTIRALEPSAFAASVLQYPIAWALLAVALAGGDAWAVGLFGAAWVLRSVAVLGVDRALSRFWPGDGNAGGGKAALALCGPVWLLPLRDVLSVAVMLASYGGRSVDWRGHAMQADSPERESAEYRSIKEVNSP